MDSNLILECFAGTLQINEQLRRQAETNLQTLSVQAGFLGACLDILEQENPIHIKKAAAVYFKNRVVKFWSIKDAKSAYRIAAEEKLVVKERILSVFLVCDHGTRQQLLPVLRLLIMVEFDDWSQLLDNTGQLLQRSEESDDYLYTAVLCLAEITRKFKWSDNKSREKQLDPIVSQAFPFILNWGKTVVGNHEQGQEITEMKAEILKLILKIYRFVTFYEIPAMLRERDQLLQWGEFHASVIEMSPPAYASNTAVSEQEKILLQISKCYKWAVANILRIFVRYASTNSLTKKIVYPDFHELFLKEFIPHYITHFLKVIEEYCHGKRWIGLSELYQLLEFLSHCVSEKSTWKMIKPHFETLVKHFIYPTVVPKDYTLEIYEDDPQEYISLCFDICGDYDNAEYAAIGFIMTSLYKHSNYCLGPISSFIQEELSHLQSQPEETLEIAKKKDGMLRILGSISGNLPKNATIAPLLTQLVIPNVKSSHDFLKARAIEVCSQFAEVPLDVSVSDQLFRAILQNFDGDNNSLPVQFNSALSIQAFIPNDQFKQALSTIILPTMSKLLELSNEIDNDAISIIMQECVENFSEQLQPFGVDLMSKLVSQFMKLTFEINEASKTDIDELDANYEDQGDKSMAALGFLNTMITVMLSFENSHEVCIKLEEICSPVIEFVIQNQMDEFYCEVGELIENALFLLRDVSPVMWKNFGFLHEAFEEGTALMYAEELLPCLTNYMIYGKQMLVQDENLRNMAFAIFERIAVSAQDDELGSIADLNLSYEFAQCFILSLGDSSVPYIPKILEVVLGNYSKCADKKMTSPFAVNSNNTLIAALVYATETTLSLIHRTAHLEPFLTWWFDAPRDRVYDLKLSILGFMKVAAATTEQELVQKIGHKLPGALTELTRAVNDLNNKRSRADEFNQPGTAAVPVEGGAEVDGNGNNDEEEWEEEEGEGEGEWDADEAAEAQKFEFANEAGFYEEDEVYEDPLGVTALDELNVYEVFKTFMYNLQQSDPERFQSLFGSLSEDEQKLIMDVVSM
ncbi:uncharacterized protein LODBEIA_P49300 [Lodderomyces beijingensis]|uniref:Importin N-terminal domain-containing protein n=1 Tax=Lodderomyces beijingensis TaxID=1775926 RepID=A0ABP0ZRB4_9ASCO